MKQYIKAADTPSEGELFGHDVDIRGYYSGQTDDPELMWIYRYDPADHVRENLALNHNAPVDLLCDLTTDESCWVRKYVLHNPNVTQDIIDSLYNDPMDTVRADVAMFSKNPEILRKMATDHIPEIRESVARNPYTPIYTLYALLNDPIDFVREAAQEARNRRR